MIVNLNLGGLVQEAGKYYSSVQDAYRQEELAKRQRAPHDNATFIKAIADAVYCITTGNKPHVFKCSEEVMPNQFTMSLDVIKEFDSQSHRHFLLHQEIMQDALKHGFQRVMILEPGVNLTNLPPLDQVANIPLSGIAALGGDYCMQTDFAPTSNPLFQRGRADEMSALLVTEAFMQKMICVDSTLFRMSTDKFYNLCSDVICMVPPAFENTQASMSEKIVTKMSNVYRSYTSMSINTVFWLILAAYFIVWWLLVLLLC